MNKETITFAYKGQDFSGKIHKGIVEAGTKDYAISKIRAMKLLPIEVKEKSTTGLNMEINIGPKKSKPKDIALVVKQLSSMIRAGLPLIIALSSVQEQTKSKVLKQALKEVSKDIENGSSFSSALAKQGQIFPPIMIGMVKIGESGGFLEESLESLSKNLDEELALRGKIKSAMSYPMVISIVAVIAVIVMLTFVVPMFEEMFSGMGEELPAPTQMLVNLSEVMPSVLPFLIIFIILFFLVWPRIKQKKQIRKIIDPIKLNTPLIGKIYKKTIIAKFAKNLSTMITAGVPLMQALDIVKDTSGNIVLENAINNLIEEVKAGRSLSGPMLKEKIIPPLMAQMVSIGEESGNIETMFENVAEYYDKEVKEATDSLTSVIEPILLILVGLLIGGMVIALYLPMFSMYDTLQQTS